MAFHGTSASSIFFYAKHDWVTRTKEYWTSHAWYKLTKSRQLCSCCWFSHYILHTRRLYALAPLMKLHLLWLCMFRQDLLYICSVKLMRYCSFHIVCNEQISVHRKDVVWSLNLPLSRFHIGTSNPREPGIWGRNWVCCRTLFLREMWANVYSLQVGNYNRPK